MKIFKLVSVHFLVAILLLSCSNTPKGNNIKHTTSTQNAKRPPNVVFILSDDQSWTDYGFMGDKNIETPRLDKFASESLTFQRGYVPTSLCSPSLATIITGMYPKNHGVLGNDKKLPGDKREEKKLWRAKNYEAVIKDFQDLTTLPDLLKEKGYLSFQTGKWWHGNHKIGGFDYGMTHGDPKRGGRHGDYGLEIGRKGMDTLTSYVDLALKEKKPFFLWYAPFLPHKPHTPPKRLLDKYSKKTDSKYLAKYWAMCEWFDETCGELFDIIENKGLTENTLFVYVCDNGWVQNSDNSRSAKNSKRAPYDLGIRTPIMYKWAGKIEPKMDTETIVSSIDMVPTVLDILNIEKPEKLQGISVLNDKRLAARKAIFGEIYAHDFNTVQTSLFYTMAISKPYKIIVPNLKRKRKSKIELYNIDKDPLEKNNIASSSPEVVANLKQLVEAFRNE